jgi:superfamily II DNA or RNA helicase
LNQSGLIIARAAIDEPEPLVAIMLRQKGASPRGEQQRIGRVSGMLSMQLKGRR